VLTRSSRRHGFTLLEQLVVLVLLGVGAAIVAPMFRLPAPSASSSTPIEKARALAVRRGEAMRLEAAGRTGWAVRATSDTSDSVLLTGSSAAPPRRMLISALGACLPEGAAASGDAAWDPARCAPARR
jgi:prepilin-type N-terminal cleavage/methylation domain-containing protein